MSDISLEQTEPVGNTDASASEPGELRVEELSDPTSEIMPVLKAELEAKIPAPQRTSNRSGTVEHLAALRAVTPLDADSPEVKQPLNKVLPEFTSRVADLRFVEASVQATT